jgi:hypothetical protein
MELIKTAITIFFRTIMTELEKEIIKAFFNTMDWWDICPTGPLPLPHH